MNKKPKALEKKSRIVKEKYQDNRQSFIDWFTGYLDAVSDDDISWSAKCTIRAKLNELTLYEENIKWRNNM